MQNLATLKGSVILIDEPELSLHPDWQQKILGFYEKLTQKDDVSPQIVSATHSPFVVHGTLDARVVILEKDNENGTIREMPAPRYPALKGEEAARAFNLDKFLANTTKPILLVVEGRSDVEILNVAWQKLRPGKSAPFEARDFLGARNITFALKDETVFSRLRNRILVGLYDFDDAFNQWNGVWKREPILGDEATGMFKKHPSHPGYALILPVPEFRQNFASRHLTGNSILSIEFLFHDRVHPSGLVQEIALPLGQSTLRIAPSMKTPFSHSVADLNASEFLAFEPLLTRLEEIATGVI